MRRQAIWRVLALAMPALAGAAAADPVRTTLQRGNLATTPSQTVTLGHVSVKANDPPGWHVHPGIETGYVLTGRTVMSMAGAPDRTLGPGDSFFIPRGVPHAARALDGRDVTVIATWVTDTGAPIASPVTAPR